MFRFSSISESGIEKIRTTHLDPRSIEVLVFRLRGVISVLNEQSLEVEVRHAEPRDGGKRQTPYAHGRLGWEVGGVQPVQRFEQTWTLDDTPVVGAYDRVIAWLKTNHDVLEAFVICYSSPHESEQSTTQEFGEKSFHFSRIPSENNGEDVRTSVLVA